MLAMLALTVEGCVPDNASHLITRLGCAVRRPRTSREIVQSVTLSLF